MADIYDQHKAAFANVSAYVILDAQGSRVATIAFKFPRDGAGRLYAYVHWFGTSMVRGFASGYGYDKRSAACASAVKRLGAYDGSEPTWRQGYEDFVGALKADDGNTWHMQLEAARFTVLKAV